MNSVVRRTSWYKKHTIYKDRLERTLRNIVPPELIRDDVLLCYV